MPNDDHPKVGTTCLADDDDHPKVRMTCLAKGDHPKGGATPALCIFILCTAIAAIESLIKWNEFVDAFSTGQLIPLVTGGLTEASWVITEGVQLHSSCNFLQG